MVRYKPIDTSPRFLAVDLKRQLLRAPSNTHWTICSTTKSIYPPWMRASRTMRPARAPMPAMLLKVILFTYSQGIVRSRGIEQACREHVTFIALCGDTAPHFTTLAGFISTLGVEVARIFGQVLFICDRQGLIGREMFAIDGEAKKSP